MTAAQVGSSAPADTVLRPVHSGNPFEEAVARIIQAIKLGLVQPGERLPPERDLSVRLGVSRVTLRAVIRALQQAGYVESKRGRNGGSFVVWQPSQPGEDAHLIAREMGARLVDALRFRSVLEPGAAALAAAAPLEAGQRAALSSRLQESRAVPLDSFRQADARLHLAIAELAGSPSLSTAVADVQLQLNGLLGAIPLLPAAVHHSHEQHARIVEGILAADPAAARAAMDEHVAATATLLRGFLA